MTLKKRKIIKIAAALIISGLLIGGGIIVYMFNMPHWDIQKSGTDISLTTSKLVSEYLSDAKAANNKYLAEDGDSKILEVTGTVAEISENFAELKVVLLKEDDDKAGVSCIFLAATNKNVDELKINEKITVKGVIRSGAAYDEDLEFYEHVILDKCDIIKSTIDTETGNIVFSVPMQSFEFEKALMQKHYNSDKYLDTKNFPKAKLKAKITNLSEINFSEDGSYEVTVKGTLTLKGVTKAISEKGTIKVKGDKIEVYSKLKIKLADYGIAFEGKVASKIAKTLEITVKAEYKLK